MPSFTVPKAVIEGRESIPGGIYELRLDGFKPSFSKNKQSINLNPILKTVDYKDPNGDPVQLYFNMNMNFGGGLTDICHAFGVPLEQNPDGSYKIPGTVTGPDNDPTKWIYAGPLLGEVAKAEVVESAVLDDTGQVAVNDKGQAKTRNEIKQFYCRVPGCTTKHMNDLTGKK